jgi:hypothetical protein
VISDREIHHPVPAVSQILQVLQASGEATDALEYRVAARCQYEPAVERIDRPCPPVQRLEDVAEESAASRLIPGRRPEY